MTKSDLNPADFKAHGYTHVSNTGGIEVMIDLRNDGVYYRFVPDSDNEIFEAEIEYNEDGEAFFMHGEVEYMLNEFMAYR